MRVLTMIQRRLEADIGSMHAARKAALFAVVAALLRGGRLPLTCLGRAVAGRTHDKHGIKRIDRLLGNESLHQERVDVQRAVARWLVGWWQRPLILIDWTEAGHGLCVLSAALAFDGRAIALWSESHPLSKLSNPDVEGQFLLHLRDVLPTGCCPILCTDAGFRVPWFKKVSALGWDYVGRLRGGVLVRAADGPTWFRSNELFARATSRPKDLGPWDIVRDRAHRCRIVLVDQRSRRARRPLPHRVRRCIRERNAAARAREPWILVTSLREEMARRIVNLYTRRMQIEQNFRDWKSHRFGWSFEDVRTRDPRRVDIFVLLATLASLGALLVGLAAEQVGAQHAYQANTTRHRRVLSLITLGRFVVHRQRPVGDLPAAFKHLRWILLTLELLP